MSTKQASSSDTSTILLLGHGTGGLHCLHKTGPFVAMAPILLNGGEKDEKKRKRKRRVEKLRHSRPPHGKSPRQRPAVGNITSEGNGSVVAQRSHSAQGGYSAYLCARCQALKVRHCGLALLAATTSNAPSAARRSGNDQVHTPVISARFPCPKHWLEDQAGLQEHCARPSTLRASCAYRGLRQTPS